MKNNYLILHGSFASPFSNWIPWLYKYLEQEEKSVIAPDLPSGVGYQTYENWKKIIQVYDDLNYINETTTIIAHSIAPIFIVKYLLETKKTVKKLIFVSGFNNYLGINEKYDAVNESMFLENLLEVKKLNCELICLYSDNDPYIKESAMDFATTVATKAIVISGGGHINQESGFTKLEEIIPYL